VRRANCEQRENVLIDPFLPIHGIVVLQPRQKVAKRIVSWKIMREEKKLRTSMVGVLTQTMRDDHRGFAGISYDVLEYALCVEESQRGTKIPRKKKYSRRNNIHTSEKLVTLFEQPWR
jgi:hypothetical protein